jgi:magnesium chelatase family protein
MSLAVVFSRAEVGITAPLVTVEVHLANGLPTFSIVGLPETAVKESKDRVRGAILNSQHDFPNRRNTVNLAPADLSKEGARFDLPIALRILVASGQLPGDALNRHEFIGELSLGGELRPVRGALTTALATQETERALIVPDANRDEAALVVRTVVLSANHLLQVSAHLRGESA